MTNRNNNATFDGYKNNIAKQAGGLIVLTNADFHSDYIVAYKFANAEIKTDNDLFALLFGRACTDNAFKADKMCINNLNRFYTEKLIDFLSTVDVFEKIAQEDNTNFGFVAEKLLCATGLYKKASNKQDKNGIDVIEIATNKRFQVKCSIVKPNSHGSAGTTNRKAHK